jgi:hypothetical protein
MVTELAAARLLTYRSAINPRESGRIPNRLDTSIAKLFASERAERIVSEALQIHGANGCQRGPPSSTSTAWSVARRLAAGTDAIQRNQIAAALKHDGMPDLV